MFTEVLIAKGEGGKMESAEQPSANNDDDNYERHQSTGSDIPNGGILEGTLIYRKEGRLKMKNMRMVSVCSMHSAKMLLCECEICNCLHVLCYAKRSIHPTIKTQ